MADEWDHITEDELHEIRDMVENTGVSNLYDHIKRKASEWKDVEINIAIVGETYVGKSTFINKLRGLEEWDEGFAPVGTGDTTRVPTPYKNPYDGKMTFWDLPGVGTLLFPKDSSYLKGINVEQYDFFVILSDYCFSENDAWLAREIRKLGKHFFFVRTKLDEAISCVDEDGQSIGEVLPRIFKSCKDNLRKANIREPQIFIISNYNHEIGQFDDLMAAIFSILPDKKREAVILSIGPLTHQIIREKKKSLHKRVFGIGVISATAAAVPFPGIDVAVDIAIIITEISFYMKEFGLDENSLRHLCKKTKTEFDQVVESLKHAKQLLTHKTTIRSLFMKIVKSQGSEALAGRFAKYVPFIGTAISSFISYGTCVYFLRQEIDLLETDAHTLIDFVLEKHAKP